MNEFLLLTLPGCRPCAAIKEHLDRLVFEDDIQNRFSYKIIDASRADDLVAKYDVQSAPTLISPNGSKLIGNPGRDRLREWIRTEVINLSESGD